MSAELPHLGPVNVRVQPDGLIHCVTCGDKLSTLTLAMLIRTSMGGSMDPLCKTCAAEIVSGAIAAFQAADLLGTIEN